MIILDSIDCIEAIESIYFIKEVILYSVSSS